MTVEQAARFVIDGAASLDPGTDAMLRNPGTREAYCGCAARRLHPGHGGSTADFQRLQDAQRLLDGHAAGPR